MRYRPPLVPTRRNFTAPCHGQEKLAAKPPTGKSRTGTGNRFPPYLFCRVPVDQKEGVARSAGLQPGILR